MLAVAPAGAADLRELIRRSVTAEKRISFQGTKLLTRRVGHDLVSTTARVFHQCPDRTLLEGVSGDLAGARILKVGRQHFQKSPEGRYQRVPLPLFPESTDLLIQNYVPRQMRVESVANRKCILVLLKPRHPGNPSKRVWLDVKSALPLKTQIWSWKGELSEETSFLAIQYHPRLAASLFLLPPQVMGAEWPEVNPDFRVLRPRPGAVPQGYRLVETMNRKLPSGDIVSFQRYCDGLNSITVLQSRTLDEIDVLAGRPALKGRAGGVYFAVYGEQDPSLLRRLVSGFHGPAVSGVR